MSPGRLGEIKAGVGVEGEPAEPERVLARQAKKALAVVLGVDQRVFRHGPFSSRFVQDHGRPAVRTGRSGAKHIAAAEISPRPGTRPRSNDHHAIGPYRVVQHRRLFEEVPWIGLGGPIQDQAEHLLFDRQALVPQRDGEHRVLGIAVGVVCGTGVAFRPVGASGVDPGEDIQHRRAGVCGNPNLPRWSERRAALPNVSPLPARGPTTGSPRNWCHRVWVLRSYISLLLRYSIPDVPNSVASPLISLEYTIPEPQRVQ